MLTGGAGSDRFIFARLPDAPKSQYDRITDFVRGEDLIDLSGIDADTTRSGNQNSGFSAVRPIFTGVCDLWTIAILSGDIVEAGLNGDGFSDLRILAVGQ